MADPLYLLYLDAYHLSDPLFAESLARLMAHRSPPLPCLIVHGSGEAGVRRLEAEGLFPETVEGRVVARSAAEAALVEQALRQATRQLVSTLTDAGVPAVGFQGADRGLLRATPDGVAPGRLAWLVELVRRGVVPVVSTLARSEGGLREVAPAAALQALGAALGAAQAPVVVLFSRTGRPGLYEGETLLESSTPEAVPSSIWSETEVLHAVVEGLGTGLLTSPAGLLSGTNPRGTRLFRPKSA